MTEPTPKAPAHAFKHTYRYTTVSYTHLDVYKRQGVYEEDAYIVTVTPRVRNYREKAKRSRIVDRSKEKEEMRLAMIQRLKEEQKLLKSYIHDGRLEFAKLPVIEPHVRDMFLLWLSKALERKDHCAKTEYGQIY